MENDYSPFRAGGMATGNYNQNRTENERLFMKSLMNRLGRQPTSQELYKAAPGAEKITLGNWMHASPNVDQTPASLRTFAYGGRAFSPDAEGGIGPSRSLVIPSEVTAGAGNPMELARNRYRQLANGSDLNTQADPLERYRMDRLRATLGRGGGKKTWR